MSMSGFMRAAQRNRTQSAPTADHEQTLVSTWGAALGELKSKVATLEDELQSAHVEIARLTEANTHLQAQADSHRADAQRHSAAAETARARADEHATARRAADEMAQREREARIVAESRPPEVKVIREPPQIVNVPAPTPLRQGDREPARVLPTVPQKLSVRVINRDPNGFMQHVELIGG